MTAEERVKARWPDAELSKAFAVQPDNSRRWMWCAMSSLKFLASRGKKKRVMNVGSWRFSQAEAWEDAAREAETPKEKPLSRLPHESEPVQVWVDIDCGIAEEVRWLNSLQGVRTFASCQGTIGEGGPHPYRSQIMAWWPEEHDAAIKERFDIGDGGTGWTYIHPKQLEEPR